MKRNISIIGLAILVLLSLMLAMSCSDDEAGNTTDGDTSIDGDQAVIDGDKADNAPDGDTSDQVAADGDSGVIITPTDGDDDSGRIEECLDDSDCFGSDYCDKSSGLCKRRKSICEECTKNEECAYREDACLPAGICGYSCQDISDCDPGFKCEQIEGVSTKQCVFDENAPPVEGNQPCCWDGNCTAPEVCHAQTGYCYAGCIGDGSSACPPGQVCVDPSDDDRNGHCKPGCDDLTPCSGGTVCVDGVCIEGDCAKKEHCPLEYKCNMTDHTCIVGCDTDGDCYGVNECIEGKCVERVGCEGTWQCPLTEVCTEELPDGDPEDRGCCFNPKTSGTEECPNPYPEGPQKFCDICTDTDNSTKECGSSSLGDNVCAELKDDNDVSLGYFCLVRQDCAVWDEGTLDEGTRQCPRGYTCVKIDDANFGGKYCLADCTKDLYSD